MDKKKIVLIISGIVVSLAVIGAIIFCIIFLNKAKQTSSNVESITSKENNEDSIVIDLTSELEQTGNEEVELTEEEKEQEKNNKYFIRVNYEANVVNIYTQDAEGKFTKPYKVMVCSTGSATPKSGTYKTSEKGRWGLMYGNVWAQYYVRICGSILFHSVPYTAKSNHTLEYWEYDKLGTTASAGCVRLTVKDAKWIYDNCSAGTEVEFYADSNPGPLGKPTAKKISNEEEVRNWDPTDPDSENPWKTYIPEVKDGSETSKNEVKTTNTINSVKNNTTNTTNNINTTKTVNNTTKNTTPTQNKTNSNIQNNTSKTTNTSQSSNATKTTNTTQGTNNTNTANVTNITNTTNTINTTNTTTENKPEVNNETKSENENKTEQVPPETEKNNTEQPPTQPTEQPSNTTTPPSVPEEPSTEE